MLVSNSSIKNSHGGHRRKIDADLDKIIALPCYFCCKYIVLSATYLKKMFLTDLDSMVFGTYGTRIKSLKGRRVCFLGAISTT